ncbi:MAG: FHA domain-containing protein [Kineosporiaceae bacterium]
MHDQVSDETTAPPGGAPVDTAVVGVLLAAGIPGAASRPVAVVHVQSLIGREDDCDVLLESPRVSRHHARVWAGGGRFGVEDLASLNGTYVNRRRVVGACELADGDRLSIADVELQFRTMPAHSVPRLPRRARPVESAHHRGATAPIPPALLDPPAPGVGQDLRPAPVLLTLLAAVAGTVTGLALDAGPWATLGLAVVSSALVAGVVSAAAGRLRVVSTVLLTMIAVVLTVTGVTAAELQLGRPIMPWTSTGGTFVSPVDLNRVLGRPAFPSGCGDEPTLTLQTPPGAARSTTRLDGHCFLAGEVVEVSLGGTLLTSVRANGNGLVATPLTVPAARSCPRNQCYVVARGAQSTRERGIDISAATSRRS